MEKLIIFIFFLFCIESSNASEQNFNNLETFNTDGTFNAIIEIPVGSREKIEYDHVLNKFQVDVVQNKKRIIQYLAYPINYGFIPKTLIKKKIGWDGDPVDILVFGDKFKTGDVVKVEIIGMLKLIDNKQIDYKVLGVTKEISKNVKGLNEFEEKYPKALKIIETWFLNYKSTHGTALLESEGYADKQETLDFIGFTSIK